MVLCLQALWRECPAIWAPEQSEGVLGRRVRIDAELSDAEGLRGLNRNGADAARANWRPREKGTEKAGIGVEGQRDRGRQRGH